MWRSIPFVLGFLILIITESLYIYLVSPFPGSQEMTNTVELAHSLGSIAVYLRILGGLLFGIPFLFFASTVTDLKKKIGLGLILVVYGGLLYATQYAISADHMFKVPENKVLLSVAENKVDLDRVVIGLHIGGEAVAYPVEIIGYHHQVYDTLGLEPVLVTYCIVCRTGRVFSPLVNNKEIKFRLVGMTQYNAMFEDPETKSWWMQATGEAVAGPLKGKQLSELPSQQMSLAAWIRLHPDTKIMQYDSTYLKKYERLEGFDRGEITTKLLKTDSLAWEPKAWVVGVKQGGLARAYDWISLTQYRLVNDQLGDRSLLIYLEPDTVSFHVWNRSVQGRVLEFGLESGVLYDLNTSSVWNKQGLCIGGELEGERLIPLQAYQEYWHSWQTFQPNTDKYPE